MTRLSFYLADENYVLAGVLIGHIDLNPWKPGTNSWKTRWFLFFFEDAVFFILPDLSAPALHRDQLAN